MCHYNQIKKREANGLSLFFSRSKFPSKKENIFVVLRTLFHLTKELNVFKRVNGLGHLMNYPTKIASFIWMILIPFNPGNLGNWTVKDKKINNVTGQFEADVIAKMISLYNLDQSFFEGYFTSGATEGNIFSAWIGRNKFEKENKLAITEICLLCSSLAHYSIFKAASVIGVKVNKVPIRDDFEGMSKVAFKNSLSDLYDKGYRGFLIPFTLGFTLTGTNDNIELLVDVASNFKKNHRDVNFYFWVDAALSGFIHPFLYKKYSFFNNSEIQTIIVDFHKFGKVPLPAGLILYKKDLRKLIESNIDYLEENDNTLLGSRTGVSPVAVWANIQLIGFNGFRKIVNKNLKEKEKFINRYSYFSDLKIITSPNNLNLGILIKKRKKFWKKYFKIKYDILFKNVEIEFLDKTQSLCIGKVFFIK